MDRGRVVDVPPPADGRPSAARAGIPVPGGREPVARTTCPRRPPRCHPRRSRRPSRTSTPSASSRRPNQAMRSVTCARDGCRPARRNWPPSWSVALRERHVMAAFRRDPRRLEPGRPTADDQHGSGRCRAWRLVAGPLTPGPPTRFPGTRSSSRATGGPSTAGCTRCMAGCRRRGRRGPWRRDADRRSGPGRC